MRGRSSPAQNAIARADPTTHTLRPASSRSARTGSRAMKRRCLRIPLTSRNATRATSTKSKIASATSSTRTGRTSPVQRPVTPSRSTSWWKRIASITQMSDSRNAVEPNAPTANSARRRRPASGTAGQPPEALETLGVEPIHVAGEVREREIAEVLHERRDLGLRACREVVLARERGRVDVEPPGAAPDEQALAVEPRHDGQQRRVRARLLVALVERFLDVADGGLPACPDLLHDLALELVQGRWTRQRHGAQAYTDRTLERVCFELRVRADRLDEYRERHRAVWPEMLAALRDAGWTNYSLFLREDGMLIGYCETDDFEAAQRAMEATEVNARWQAEMAPLFERGLSFDRLAEVFPLD